jgi:shikimate dehydrogenase
MKHYGLIGFPLIHSFSKKYFSAKFEQESVDASYELFELENIAQLTDIIENNKLDGLNVTIPYKEQVINYLNSLDDTAAKIGAVNVIKFDRSEGGLKLKGYNSDAIGFENSIKPFLHDYHKKALILGTGGASKAVDYTLQKLGIQTCFVTRTPKQGMFNYYQLNEDIIADNLIIVNTSPVGTFPHADECPDIPYQYLTEKHLLYDLVYNPAETLFLKKGMEKGVEIQNGEAMLIGQAEAAWKIWNK